MADTVRVQFSASIGALIKGVDDAKNAIESVRESTDKVTEGAKSLLEAFGVAFSVEAIKDYVAQMGELGEQTERTRAMLGGSTTYVQELGYIAKATGGDAEGLALAMERLQVNLQKAQSGTGPAAEALKALGLNAKTLSQVPLQEQMNRIADAVSHFADGGNKTAIVMELMGRSGAQMIPVLDKGRAGLDELRDASVETGAVMTAQTVEALAKMKERSTELGASLQGLGGTLVGLAANEFGSFSEAVMKTAGNLTALASTGQLGEYFAVTAANAWHTFALQVELAGTVVSDFFTKSHFSDISADIQKGETAIDHFGAEAVAQLDAISARAKNAYKDFLAAANAGEPQKPQAPSSAPENKDATKAAAEQLKEQERLAQEQYSTTVKLADEQFNQTKEHLEAEAKLHEITYDQETQGLLSALDRRRAAEQQAVTVQVGTELAAVEQEIAADAKGTAAWQTAVDKQTQLLQKATDERREIDAKYFAERQKMVDQAAEQEQKEWKSAADQISGAFNSQLQKLLSGKETWAQASRKIEQDLVLKFLEDQIKATGEYLAQLERQVAAKLAAESGMTAATTAGNAIRTATDVASGDESILAVIGNALKAIGAGAGQTAAAVSAEAAPEVGPAAPAVGLAAGATIAAGSIGLVSGFAVGTDFVRSGGLAIVHEGEQIKPAQGSGPYTGGNGGDVHVHMPINITAMDSRSVKRFFSDNGGTALKAIHAAARNGAHLGLSRT